MGILSSEKGLFKSFAHLKIGLFIFLLLSYKKYLYILDTSPLLDTWFENIFCSMGYLSFFLMVPFVVQVFSFNEAQFISFFFCHLCSWCHIQKGSVKLKLMKISSCFLLKPYNFSSLIQISDPFELILCMVWCKKPGLFLCTWIIRGPNTIYWKRLFLFALHGIVLTSCQNQLSITIRVYFWIPHSFLLICKFIFMTVSHYLGYCIFIVSFEFGKFEPSNIILLF